MICETCHGQGNTWSQLTQQYLHCMDCNGSGIMSCCDGAVPTYGPTIQRLIEEVKNEKITTQGYNRVYNRHHRS